MTETDFKTKSAVIPGTPTLERHRHNGGVSVQTVSSYRHNYQRYQAIAECTLDVYALQGKLTTIEHRMGMKFRHAYLGAVLKIKVDDRDDTKGVIPITVACERRLRTAYALFTIAEKNVIIAVCGHNEWAGSPLRLDSLRQGLLKLTELWS